MAWYSRSSSKAVRWSRPLCAAAVRYVRSETLRSPGSLIGIEQLLPRSLSLFTAVITKGGPQHGQSWRNVWSSRQSMLRSVVWRVLMFVLCITAKAVMFLSVVDVILLLCHWRLQQLPSW